MSSRMVVQMFLIFEATDYDAVPVKTLQIRLPALCCAVRNNHGASKSGLLPSNA